MRRHRVVALAYEGLCTFEFGIAVEAFALPRPELKVPWYVFSVCALEPGPLRAMGGVTVHVDSGLGALARADTIVIPGWRNTAKPRRPACCRRYERPTGAARVLFQSARAYSFWLRQDCSMANGQRRTGDMQTDWPHVFRACGSSRMSCTSTKDGCSRRQEARPASISAFTSSGQTSAQRSPIRWPSGSLFHRIETVGNRSTFRRRCTTTRHVALRVYSSGRSRISSVN